MIFKESKCRVVTNFVNEYCLCLNSVASTACISTYTFTKPIESIYHISLDINKNMGQKCALFINDTIL